MSDIVISLATHEQREACYHLAWEVYCEEMGIVRDDADNDLRIVRDEAIEAANVLHATVDGELAGTMGVCIGTEAPFPEHSEHGFDIPRFLAAVPRTRMALNLRFVVKPEFRGTPLPFRMMVEAGRLQLSHGVQLVFCECQPHLLNLYRGLGFRPCAPMMEKAGFGVMVPLVLSVTDLAHLRAIRSPFLRYFPKGVEDAALAARIRALLPEESVASASDPLDRATWSETFGLLSQGSAGKGPFEGFSEAEVTAFLDRSHVLECADGQQIVATGQATRAAFVVLGGAAEVRVRGKTVARFERGQLFGEFALLLHTKRTADVFASGERVRLLVLDERTLERLLATNAPLASKFLLNLSRSLALRLLSRA